MRLTALTWPFPFGVRLGWATARTPNPPLGEAVGRVYLLRGAGLFFSGGFGRICSELRQAGWWAEDLRCVGDRWMRRHLIADHQADHLRGPIVMVGHSCGGRYSLYSAQQLATLGINIDLLICVDVAWPFPVASNVKCAAHLYRSRWRVYPARSLVPAPGSTARIENIDVDEVDSPIREWGMVHMNVTSYRSVQEWILKRILHLTPAMPVRHHQAV
jgi:hypothetical protein